MLTPPPQHHLLCQNLLWSTISTRWQEAELLSGEYMGGATLLGHPSVKSCTRTSSLITICSTWCAGESCWFYQVAHPVDDLFLKVSSQSVSISQREVIQVTSAGLKISHIHHLCFWKSPFLTAGIHMTKEAGHHLAAEVVASVYSLGQQYLVISGTFSLPRGSKPAWYGIPNIQSTRKAISYVLP